MDLKIVLVKNLIQHLMKSQRKQNIFQLGKVANSHTSCLFTTEYDPMYHSKWGSHKAAAVLFLGVFNQRPLSFSLGHAFSCPPRVHSCHWFTHMLCAPTRTGRTREWVILTLTLPLNRTLSPEWTISKISLPPQLRCCSFPQICFSFQSH